MNITTNTVQTKTEEFDRKYEEHTLSLLEIFEHQLERENVRLCRGCDKYASHVRGFSENKSQVVHFSASISTRSTLFTGLHEIGHIVSNKPGMRRWQEEQTATDYARHQFKRYGLILPRRITRQYKAYIARMKRWGDNITAGRAS